MPRTETAAAPPWSSRASAASRISSSVVARRGPRRRGAVVVMASTPHLDFLLDSVQYLYRVQRVQSTKGLRWDLDDDRDLRYWPSPHDRRAVRGVCPRLRGVGHRSVLDVRLARHPARAGRCGAAGVRRWWEQPGLDLVRHRLDVRAARGPDAPAAGRTRPPP